MILAEAIELFEKRFATVLPGLPSMLSQTGERYTMLSLAGPVSEGGFLPFCSTAELAAQAWYLAAVDYATALAATKGKPLAELTLYWRVKPEGNEGQLFQDNTFLYGREGHHYSPVTICKVYSRLLITDQPVLEEHVS